MASKVADFDGKMTHPKVVDGCASCMFNVISCGTVSMCPTSVGGKIKVTGDDTLEFVDNFFCWVCCPSPIPCFNGCGVGPCSQQPRFKRETDTHYVGTGESLLAGRCCTPCCHNNGDQLKLVDGKAEWWAGNSPAIPMCFHGKKIVEFELAAGGPTCDEMQR